MLLSAPTDNGPGETLATLQQNFLLQDDLTTFLDACISSLDLLQRRERAQSQDIEALRRDAKEAELKFADVKDLRERVMVGPFDGNRSSAIASIESDLRRLDADLQTKRTKLNEALHQSQPVSRFGEYCASSGLPMLIQANVERIDAHSWLLETKRSLSEAQARETTLRICEVALRSGATIDDKTKVSCANALGQGAASAMPIVQARQ